MPLRNVRPLEPTERAALPQQFMTSTDARLMHLTQAVLLSAEGWAVPMVPQQAEALTDEPTALALDVAQAELALNSARTQVWAPPGVPWELETPGTNRKQILFGAVSGELAQCGSSCCASRSGL